MGLVDIDSLGNTFADTANFPETDFLPSKNYESDFDSKMTDKLDNTEMCQDPQNQTLLPLLRAIKSIKANMSMAANYVFNSKHPNEQSFYDADENIKFPSNRYVRDIQWHPHCRSLPTSNYVDTHSKTGKPRVAIRAFH